MDKGCFPPPSPAITGLCLNKSSQTPSMRKHIKHEVWFFWPSLSTMLAHKTRSTDKINVGKEEPFSDRGFWKLMCLEPQATSEPVFIVLRATQELYHLVSQPQLPKWYYLVQKEHDAICSAIICVTTTCAMQMSWAEMTAGFGVRSRTGWILGMLMRLEGDKI